MSSYVLQTDVDSVEIDLQEKFERYGIHPLCIGCEHGECIQYNAPGLTRFACRYRGVWRARVRRSLG